MIVPVNGEKLESFTYFQLFGFIILFTGVLFYNEMVTLPFFGFNKYTKKAIASREETLVKVERKSLSVQPN
jgi:hypothetical protein